jgi:hypothetical protein
VPKDETLKLQCVEIAQNIKQSQIQYSELVTGAPSAILNSLESLDETVDKFPEGDESKFE